MDTQERIFEDYKWPAHIEQTAREGIATRGIQTENLGNGVDLLSGHNKGLAYRFFILPVYNIQKSRISGFEEFDEVECIQHFVTSKHKPTCRVIDLTEDRLRFNIRGEPVGGLYFDAYKRWKAGVKMGGTSLDKWDILTPSVVATLNSEGIFTIEQFASRDETWVRNLFKGRQEFIEAFERAVQHVASRDLTIRNKEQADKLFALTEENRKLRERIEALEANQNKQMLPAPAASAQVNIVKDGVIVESSDTVKFKRGRGRPRKIQPSVNEEKIENEKEI